MRISFLLLIILLSCKGRRLDYELVKVKQIDGLIEGNKNHIAECYRDSFFGKAEQIINRDTGIERGKYVIVDTLISTFFCDTIGEVHLVSTVLGNRFKRNYSTYFAQGNIVKVVELFDTDPRHLDISEYYLDHDTVFFKKEGEHYYSDMKSWISFIKNAYHNFDSSKK